VKGTAVAERPRSGSPHAYSTVRSRP